MNKNSDYKNVFYRSNTGESFENSHQGGSKNFSFNFPLINWWIFNLDDTSFNSDAINDNDSEPEAVPVSQPREHSTFKYGHSVSPTKRNKKLKSEKNIDHSFSVNNKNKLNKQSSVSLFDSSF